MNCTSPRLGVPVLVSPIDGSTIGQNPPTYIWQGVEDTGLYWLQVSRESSFSQTTINVSCYGDTSYEPNNQMETGTYYWRVCAEEGS